MSNLPALLGGAPVRPGGPPKWPLADDDVRAALKRVYGDGSWGVYHGPNCKALEERLRQQFQVEHILLCGSGTYAVELGLRALKIGPGDEVILADYDFPGNFLTIHAVGAVPVLVDVDPGNWNLSLASFENAIGPATKAVLVSHLHGGLVPMRALTMLAKNRGLAVLEDAAQCPGAMIQGRCAGTWGDAGIISFGGSKLLSAGRGGALLTPHDEVAQRARTLQLRGNLVCPLSELQAAVVVPQLEKLAERRRRRAENVRRLLNLLIDVPGLLGFANPQDVGEPDYYKAGFQYDAAAFGLPRARFLDALQAEGIALSEGFAAAHVGRSPRRFRQGGGLHEAERAHNGCIVLHHPVLLGSPEDIADVAQAVHKIHQCREALACYDSNKR